MTTPLTFVALTRRVLAELIGPGTIDAGPVGAGAGSGRAELGRLLDERAHAVILGSDLLDRPDSPEPGIDPSVAAITLARFTSRVGLVVAAAPQRDHPYNLARRVASIEHASGGRAGVAVAVDDPTATPGSPWTTADPEEAAIDAVVALRELWRSFPVDTIVADRETGVFAESHRIVAIDHRGAFDITGPFQVPTGPQIWPPILAWTSSSTELARIADLTVDDTTDTGGVTTVLRPRSGVELLTLLAELPELRGATSDHVDGPTLRARLGLSSVTPSHEGRVVFAAPAAQPTGAAHV